MPLNAHFQSSLPLVVASVNGPDDLPFSTEAHNLADFLEWRLDGLKEIGSNVIASFINNAGLPAILTARRSDEGGFSGWKDEEVRLRMMDALVKPGYWLDIEARTLEEYAEWRAAAARWRTMGAYLLVSCHDFVSVPTKARMAEVARIAADHAADVVKIAGTTHSLEETLALAEIFRTVTFPRLSVMGMGKFGMASRLLYATAGSVFNYGYLRAASVPGQWSARDFRTVLRAAGLRS